MRKLVLLLAVLLTTAASAKTDNTKVIKQLRAQVAEQEQLTAQLDSQIVVLKGQIDSLRNRPLPCVAPRIITREVAVLQPMVVFKKNSTKLDKLQYAVLESVARYMNAHSNIDIYVNGFASVKEKKVEELSMNRAEAVKSILVEKFGVKADRIMTSGKGSTTDLSEDVALNAVVTIKLGSL